jgi:hypothetical protein
VYVRGSLSHAVSASMRIDMNSNNAFFLCILMLFF